MRVLISSSPTPTDLIYHGSFGPELFSTPCMLLLFDVLSPGPEGKAGLDEWMKVAVSGCPHERVLEAAFAWLNGIGDEELHHHISFKELMAVRAKTEMIAASLTFEALSGLYAPPRPECVPADYWAY